MNVALRHSPSDNGDTLWRPHEGWLTLGLLLVMVLAVGASVDDSRWAGVTPGGGSETGFLPWVLVLATLWGYASAKVRWPALLAHVVGAALGAAVVIVLVAGTIPTAQPHQDGAFVCLSGGGPFELWNLGCSVRVFVDDVFIRHLRSSETSAFLLIVGIVAWASAQFAAYAVYRRRRPMSAILLIGLLLLANMSLTIEIQFWYLVVFSVSALLLLVRLSASEQRLLWSHGRLGDEESAFALYLRNGLAFIAIALVGALVLTTNASSDPLRWVWNGASDQLVALGEQVDTWAGGIVAPVRGPAGLFAASQTIHGIFESDVSTVLTVKTSDGQPYYWRGATYDDFDGRTWRQTDRVQSSDIPAGQPILDQTTDAVKPGSGRKPVTVTVTPVDWGGDTILAPEDPYTAAQTVDVVTTPQNGAFDTLRLSGGVQNGQPYQVTSLVRVEGDGGITGNQLAAAGITYPGWARRYIAIEPGSIGPIVKRTADQIVSRLPLSRRDPYDVAVALQDYLYAGGNFTYDTDVRGICAGETSVVDCLLTYRHGYCEYFASALTMMLRTQQIPARYVVGYLPGHQATDGSFVVDRSAAHAWVEVYFPKIGWIRFDPTPGNQLNGQAPTVLPSGPPVATPKPSSSANASGLPVPSFVAGDNGPDPRVRPVGAGSGQTPSGTDPLPLLLAVLIVGAVAVLVVWTRLRRVTLASPEAAYSGVTRIAARFGYGPRPSQTPFEYGRMLGEALPRAAPDVDYVVTARVEHLYGRREVEPTGLAALRQAYGRLRFALLRLAFRGRRWRR